VSQVTVGFAPVAKVEIDLEQRKHHMSKQQQGGGDSHEVWVAVTVYAHWSAGPIVE
jgi:hypothetical protein